MFAGIPRLPGKTELTVLAALIAGLAAAFSGKTQTLDLREAFDSENLPKVRELLSRGEYQPVEQITNYGISRGQPSPDWKRYKLEAMMALGRMRPAFADAMAWVDAGASDLSLLMTAFDVMERLGESEAGDKILQRVNEVALKKSRDAMSASDLVALGKAAEALGADPQKIIQDFYEPAKSKDPKSVEPYLALGELALHKSDFARAANEFRAALKEHADDPDVRFGLARAFFSDDREESMKMVDRVLNVNPRHAGALLLRTESLIDAEQYDDAGVLLEVVLAVNPSHPEGWAFKAVLANLTSKGEAAYQEARNNALEQWDQNPEVDHLIGRVLSRNYRFAEGAAHQKLALKLDPDYLPAKLQLCHDYLRLGKEEEAWALAEEVAEKDPYNIQAFNLTILEDQIGKFTTIDDEKFVMRLPEREAKIYGDRALELLRDAHTVLCDKYGLELTEPVLVEFFPEQQDFAIRTFGNLGGQGILGACFGSVVTMNSPGGLAAERNNWEATLWHEFCHVVTLTVTHNKMPRWLSEGISVYEEMERDPSWGQKMTPAYRRMIVEKDELTPVSELSSAFMSPESGEHLMFAYYEAMLVVKFLIDNYRVESFQGILKDLAGGVLINDAIAHNTAPISEIEEKFEAYVHQVAEDLAPGVDWKSPTPEEVNPRDPMSVARYMEANPNNFWARQQNTLYLLGTEQWDAAVASAQALIDLYPDYIEEDSGYWLKAQAHRALKQPDKEAEALMTLALKSSEAAQAYDRLMELSLENEDWEQAAKIAGRAMALNPFSRRLHFALGRGHEAAGERGLAIESYRRLLLLNPPNLAEVKLDIGRLLAEDDATRAEAKRFVLDALVEAPRYREAHELLLKLQPPSPPES